LVCTRSPGRAAPFQIKRTTSGQRCDCMIFRLGFENNNDGRSIDWAPEHRGCFACGRDAAEALASFPPKHFRKPP